MPLLKFSWFGNDFEEEILAELELEDVKAFADKKT